MDLLLILLVGIIGILIFLLLKKERVFGIKEENKIENKTLKNEVVTDNKENIYKLFNYIPEAIIILNKSKEILFSNSSAQKRFEISENNNINSNDVDIDDRDILFKEAANIIVIHQQGSASLLQRKLKLGYNRAGRIIDQLEAANIIGPYEGSRPRQVLVQDEISLNKLLDNMND